MKIESSRQVFTEQTNICIYWAPVGAKKDHLCSSDHSFIHWSFRLRFSSEHSILQSYESPFKALLLESKSRSRKFMVLLSYVEVTKFVWNSLRSTLRAPSNLRLAVMEEMIWTNQRSVFRSHDQHWPNTDQYLPGQSACWGWCRSVSPPPGCCGSDRKWPKLCE